MLPRIIDRDPFLEFYHFDGIGKEVRIFTIGEITLAIESNFKEKFSNETTVYESTHGGVRGRGSNLPTYPIDICSSGCHSFSEVKKQ